jgi:hypothetical protein
LKLLLKLGSEAEAELLVEQDRTYLGQLGPQPALVQPQELQQEVWAILTG